MLFYQPGEGSGSIESGAARFTLSDSQRFELLAAFGNFYGGGGDDDDATCVYTLLADNKAVANYTAVAVYQRILRHGMIRCVAHTC